MSASNTLRTKSSHPDATQESKQSKQLEISWLALETGHPYSAYASRLDNSIETLLEGKTADIVVVDGPQSVVNDAMKILRGHPDYAERLIFLGRPSDEHAEALADGNAPTDISIIMEKWEEWNTQRKNTPPIDSSSDPLLTIDRWLSLRPNTWIKPIRNPVQRHLYSYPLVNALLNKSDIDGLTLLEDKWRKGHYERGFLTDRIRTCRECNSGHLNYVDLCSQCRSLQIERQPCLHCFVCGHVNRQDKFRSDEGLSCPNCLTQLRHIGTDYDRPVENYQCRSCHSLFIDAAVEARCLSCGHRHETDELRVREIRPFRLSQVGRLQGNQTSSKRREKEEQDTGDSRLITREKFIDLVNWQLSIYAASQHSPAYATLCPALIAVRLVPDTNQEADWNAAEKMERWMHAIVQALTTSERAQRERQDLIWILRPHCRSHDIQTFHHYLQRHLQIIFKQEESPLSVDVQGRILSQTDNSNEDAELIQAHLLSELHKSNYKH